MSQRRIRGNQAATVNYKELYEEEVQRADEAEARLEEIAAIAAPEVDHERLERIEAALVLLLKDRFGLRPADEPFPDSAAQELVQQMEGVESGS